MKPGDIFGEIALLDGHPRTADAVALDDCDLLLLERRHVLPFLERQPLACLRLLQVLCQRFRRTSALLEDSLALDVPSRLARCLRSEEHTSELQSLMRISYAVFCLKKKHQTR